jgi:hypothetical protein
MERTAVIAKGPEATTFKVLDASGKPAERPLVMFNLQRDGSVKADGLETGDQIVEDGQVTFVQPPPHRR